MGEMLVSAGKLARQERQGGKIANAKGPNAKQWENTKLQRPNAKRLGRKNPMAGRLRVISCFGISDLFGVWNLAFGICAAEAALILRCSPA